MKTILIVDDEENIINLVKTELKHRGYSVVTANNGIEALEVLKQFSPELIILDVNMPEMGGVKFYSEIADGHGKPRYNVLFLSTREELSEMFTQELDAAGFIPKPFKIMDLMAEVERIIGDTDDTSNNS